MDMAQVHPLYGR